MIIPINLLEINFIIISTLISLYLSLFISNSKRLFFLVVFLVPGIFIQFRMGLAILFVYFYFEKSKIRYLILSIASHPLQLLIPLYLYVKKTQFKYVLFFIIFFSLLFYIVPLLTYIIDLFAHLRSYRASSEDEIGIASDAGFPLVYLMSLIWSLLLIFKKDEIKYKNIWFLILLIISPLPFFDLSVFLYRIAQSFILYRVIELALRNPTRKIYSFDVFFSFIYFFIFTLKLL